ncbi:hypothetical protein [Vibrio paucivorans]|uniref:Uncharacterized protein n=1 Tax=Vibrio paucivorans TaxID=2829489 RepID=A0A9X3CIH6_9VIBR|nr:hypothetical protein [Vibrio paucivorans]MCW8336454.1 hypothetical protein [Vibrio paucivorans]
MNFDGYFEKKREQIERIESLDALIVRQWNKYQGKTGLPYKVKQGKLIRHLYTHG